MKQNDIEQWLLSRIAELTGEAADRFRPDAEFTEIGLSSRNAVVLIGELQDYLGRELSATLAWDYPTVRALARHLAAAAGQPAPDGRPAHAADPDPDPNPVPVAVIGMACRFPGAVDAAAYWSLLDLGQDGVAADSGRHSQRPHGFLPGIDQFDAGFFGISDAEADYLDPQQRLLLEIGWQALEDAAISATSLAGSRTGIFVGISGSDYGHLLRAATAPRSRFSTTGQALSIAANRLSYLLDVRGPSLAVDTACSSSLVAVHLAARSLRSGESDLALTGGVNVLLDPELTEVFAEASMIAPDGRCKSFDAAADGYVRSEGCGIVVLKRLPDALADGDRVLGVLAGSAVMQDGRTNGLTAPNGPAQESVLRAALDDAQMRPADIGYFEAHGTGTALGDQIEIGAVTAVFGGARDHTDPLILGSVKANIGHTEAAAGIAALIKVLLMLRHRRVPGQIHLRELSPRLTAGAPVSIPRASHDWTAPAGRELTAGINAFGFGGTNAHLIVREPPAGHDATPAAQPDAAPAGHLLAVSAQSESALMALAGRYAAWLRARPGADLGSVARTTTLGRAHLRYRAAVVASNPGEAADALESLAVGAATVTTATTTAVADPRIHSVARRYAAGEDIDWADFHRGGHTARADLPGYPFERRRHWLPSAQDAQDAQVPSDEPDDGADPVLAALQRVVTTQLGQRSRVDPDISLLELGADSVALFHTLQAVQQTFCVAIPIASVFAGLNTLNRLAGHIRDSAPPRVLAEISPAEPPAKYPLSRPQQEMWLLHQMGPDYSRAYVEGILLELRGELDLDALGWAVGQVLARHDGLHAVIAADGTHQRVIAPPEVELPCVDLSGLPAGERQRRLNAWLEARASELPDLTVRPPVRSAVLKLAADDHRLYLAVHHILIDGWSFDVIAAEIAELYDGRINGGAPTLAEPVSYREHVRWEQRHEVEPAWQASLDYWLEHFADGVPGLALPAGRPVPAPGVRRVGTIERDFAADVTGSVAVASRRLGVTSFTLMLAAYSYLLHRLSGQDDLVIGVPFARRSYPGGELVVGNCTAPVLIRSRLAEGALVRDHVGAVQAALIAAHEHPDFPVAALRQRIQVGDGTGGRIFAASFNLNYTRPLRQPRGLRLGIGPAPRRFAKTDLTFDIFAGDGADLRLVVYYDTSMFEQATVELFVAEFLQLLGLFCADQEAPLPRPAGPVPSELPETDDPETDDVDASLFILPM